MKTTLNQKELEEKYGHMPCKVCQDNPTFKIILSKSEEVICLYCYQNGKHQSE